MDRQAEAALRRAIGMLEAILIRQTTLHREMLDVAEDKRDAIMSGDLQKLEQAVLEEKKLISQIEDEEKRRLAVMPLVKTGLGLDVSVDKLLDVINAMPEDERERLLPLRNELRKVLENCQLKTRHNAELLKASLEHVGAFLRTISEAANKDTSYRRDGKRAGGGPAIIDRSA